MDPVQGRAKFDSRVEVFVKEGADVEVHDVDWSHRRPSWIECERVALEMSNRPLVGAGQSSQAHTALVVIAISAGSIIASHVNDGGFWIVSRYFGIPVKETLQTWTVLETILSIVGFAVAAALSLVV